MKPGDKILVLYKLVRPVKVGDRVNGIEILSNKGDHLWWAANEGGFAPAICVCTDEFPEGFPPIPAGLTGANFKT